MEIGGEGVGGEEEAAFLAGCAAGGDSEACDSMSRLKSDHRTPVYTHFETRFQSFLSLQAKVHLKVRHFLAHGADFLPQLLQHRFLKSKLNHFTGSSERFFTCINQAGKERLREASASFFGSCFKAARPSERLREAAASFLRPIPSKQAARHSKVRDQEGRSFWHSIASFNASSHRPML